MPIVEHLVPSANVRQLMDIGVKPPPRDLLQLTGVAHVAALLVRPFIVHVVMILL